RHTRFKCDWSSDVCSSDLLVHGIHEPTSEMEIHSLAYRTRPTVGGCVHVESPYVNTLYSLNLTIPNILGNFVYLFAGKGLALARSEERRVGKECRSLDVWC